MTQPAFTDAQGHQIQYVLEKKNCLSSHDFAGDVDDTISQLEALKQKAGKDIRLDISWSRDEEEYTIHYDLYSYRYETDAERDERLLRLERERIVRERREQEQKENDKQKEEYRIRSERTELLRLLRLHGHPADWE